MTKRISSKDFPEIIQLQGVIQIPYNIKTQEGFEQTGYTYNVVSTNQFQTLNGYKNLIWRALQQELKCYINAQYDEGEQATITGYAVRASNADRQDIVSSCLPVQAWIDDVLSYYDTKKQAIFVAGSLVDLMVVNWDFDTDVPIQNRVDWRDVRALF